MSRGPFARRGLGPLLGPLLALAAGWGSLALATPPGPLLLGPPPPSAPKRVVTLAPSLTDTVLALGRGEALVGVSRFDTQPQVQRLPRVGGFLDPSVEAVLSLHPDLVLVQPSPGNRAPVERMASLGVPIVALPLQTVSDVLAAFRATAKALGVPGRGEQLARQLEDARASVRALARQLKAPRVLFVYGFEPLVVAGPGAFADELLSDAGGVNAAAQAKTPYPVYSLESALAARPEVVVDASNSSAGRVRLRALPGLSSARWVTLPSQDLLHPGPRLVQGLWELFRLLHPEAASR